MGTSRFPNRRIRRAAGGSTPRRLATGVYASIKVAGICWIRERRGEVTSMNSAARWMLGLSGTLSLALFAQAQGQEGPGPEGGAVVMVQPGMSGMGPATVAFG